MRRVIATLALSLCLAACGSATSSGGRVDLVTGVDSCYLGGAGGVSGQLAADPEFGTTFNGHPAMWPMGYAGLWVGHEVEVFDPSGKLVAMTGRRYYFSQARVGNPENVKRMKSLGAIPVGDCGYSWSLVDLNAAAAVPTAVIVFFAGWIAIGVEEIRWRLIGVATAFGAMVLMPLFVGALIGR